MNQTDPETARLHNVILEREAEIATLRDLLGKENQRANAAIDREETAEQAALEARQELDEARAAVSAVVSPPTDRAAGLSDAERTMLTYALDQAQERIWVDDGFTHEDQAALDSLRRLAVEAHGTGIQQPSGEDVVEAHRLALSEALHLGNGAPWDAILDRAGDLSRRDVGAQQQPDTEAPTRPTCTCQYIAEPWIKMDHAPDCPARPAPVAQQPAAADDEETWFGMPGCTCRAFTRHDGQPRYLEPHETVDKVSGWEPGADCPHHAPRP